MILKKRDTLTELDVLKEIAYSLHTHYGEPLMTRERFDAEYQDNAEQFLPYFEDTLRSYALIDQVSYRNHPDYDLLFEPFSESINESCSQLLPLDRNTLSDEAFLKVFSLMFEQEIKTMEAYYQWIQSEPLDDSAKYRLMLLGSSRSMLIGKYQGFMEQFKDVASQITTEMAAKVKAYINSIDATSFIEDAKAIGMDLSGYETIHVAGFAIGQNAFRVVEEDTIKDGKSINIMIGIRVFDVWRLRVSQGIHKDRILKRLKLLSDATKFEILMFCLNDERYGKEIAAHVALSEATVSHHMQQLLSEQFVSVRIEKNRTYYKTAKQTVLQLTQQIETIMNS